jgi:hypothetical protein
MATDRETVVPSNNDKQYSWCPVTSKMDSVFHAMLEQLNELIACQDKMVATKDLRKDINAGQNLSTSNVQEELKWDMSASQE